MDDQQLSQRLGTMSLSPTDDVVAGSMGQWTLTFRVGSYGIDSGGQFKIAFPLVSDWETPQFDGPSDSGYTTVTTDGPAKLGVSWQPRGNVRPWTGCIVIDVYDESLDQGDTVTIRLGDRSEGSPGMRAQTYQESRHEFRTLVDPTNACHPRPIPKSPVLAVVAGSMKSMACIAPSQSYVNKPIHVLVKGEDRWRNPTPPPEDYTLDWVGDGEASIEGNEVTISEPGVGYVTVRAGPYECRSNPIEILGAPCGANRYWGDLHAQTAGTVGTGTEDEYFTFGRDWAGLDFISHQGNDFQISDEYWQHLNTVSERYHEDGEFVVFPGYEWSANSPAGGDHNVIYRAPGQPILRSSHWLIPDTPETELSPAHPASVFYARLKQVVPVDDVLVCAHVGGRYANVRKHFDRNLVTLVELVSCWGVFEWMLWDAFDKGYVVGVMCNSDGHHGRPGAEGSGVSEFGIANGLTCVLAPSLTRDAVFDALKSRRCYGTTGARMILDFTANGRPMGSVLPEASGTVELKASVTGCGPVESLQLFQGRNLIAEARPSAFDDLNASNRIRVSWQGSRGRGRQRRVTWDGEVRVEGCRILSATPFSFDVVSDGITEQSAQSVRFRSRTTGDRDGLDLLLDSARSGRITFSSAAGAVTVPLDQLAGDTVRRSFDFGGVDQQVVIEHYPAAVEQETLSLIKTVSPPAEDLVPYFVKATQVDGEMAWSSPIYLTPAPIDPSAHAAID